MIMFSIVVPADLPAPLSDWLRQTIALFRAMCTKLGYDIIGAEVNLEAENEEENKG